MNYIHLFLFIFQDTLERWQIVFWLCVPMYIGSAAFFFIFVSVSIQPWNYKNSYENKEKGTTIPLQSTE